MYWRCKSRINGFQWFCPKFDFAALTLRFSGKDDKSVQAARALEEETISSRMDRDDFVSVRVEADTEAFVFFQQICILFRNLTTIANF